MVDLERELFPPLAREAIPRSRYDALDPDRVPYLVSRF